MTARDMNLDGMIQNPIRKHIEGRFCETGHLVDERQIRITKQKRNVCFHLSLHLSTIYCKHTDRQSHAPCCPSDTNYHSEHTSQRMNNIQDLRCNDACYHSYFLNHDHPPFLNHLCHANSDAHHLRHSYRCHTKRSNHFDP